MKTLKILTFVCRYACKKIIKQVHFELFSVDVTNLDVIEYKIDDKTKTSSCFI